MKPDSPTPPPPAEAFARLCELTQDINIAMLGTVGADGALRSRPMATQEVDAASSTFWFFTAVDSPKADEITDDQHVNLAYAEPAKNKYVSVSGRARMVRDPAKARKLWTPFAKAWFPGGPEDPRLVLLKVQATAAEYWDSPSSRMVQLFGLAKAALTGHGSAALGQNVKVDVNPAR